MARPGPFQRFRALVRAFVAVAKALPQLNSVDNRGGWWPIIRESFAGAWQQNIAVDTTTVLSFAALYACIALISSDIAKLRVKLVELKDGIWVEVANAAYSPVLRKPNHYQTRIQFFEAWVTSKLIHGNTYVLKRRNAAHKVDALYVLDPTRVRPLVAVDGDVFYELKKDDLSTEHREVVMVPASEIIHDRMTPLFHPLVGVSPIRACGLAALQGLKIQENSTLLFSNGATPGGVITTEQHIPTDTVARLKTEWSEKYSGANVGQVAILGDGLKFESGALNAVDAQLIEQLKWTAENVCTAFRVPAYMIGVGTPPSYNNIEALNTQYYTQCLQIHFESIEILLDEGLGLNRDGEPVTIGTEFDLEGLLRMDTSTKVKAVADMVKSGVLKPNEGRAKFDMPPVKGGDTPYLQQQNYSLAALAKRDAKDDPFATGRTSPTPPSPTAPPTAGAGDKAVPAVNVFESIGPLMQKELDALDRAA